jgi:hypothetical protein
MQVVWRFLLALGVLHMSAAATAQIYTCTAKDGTRIFSDERCGPDAKVVPGITTNKKPEPKTSTVRPTVEPKSAAELASLLEQCNGGDMKACDTWTRGGGPNSLRDKERAAEKACESGSLADCEYRYCNGSINEECRTRVLQTAKVAGDNWYLPDTGKQQPDGSTRYTVRCVPATARAMRDVVITCSGKAAPNRCADTSGTVAPQLDQAATTVCAVVR